MVSKRAQFFPLRDDNPTRSFGFVNLIFIIINVIVFIITYSSLDHFIQTYGFTPAYFSVLTIFTSMFLHAGVAHIVGNMWFLYIFGDNVEDRLGHVTYLFFYLLAGVFATLAHYLLNIGSVIPSVGASGAISGVLGAYIVFFPNAGVYVTGGGGVGRVSAFMMLGLWFLFQLFSGAAGLFGAQSGIAFFAHIGGFVFGVIFALIYKRISPE
ncbi:rhomboid family intramembrane serine protease [Candidatus Pacearchaeota archaeon]|nr:rhomboid family intramembrane serine protease [Candidatus Pacearchaeota archaeon]